MKRGKNTGKQIVILITEMYDYSDLLAEIELGDVFDPSGYSGIADTLTESFE